MSFSTFFFDLDETLYPSSSGLWVEIRGRINAYMHERMGFSWEQIEGLREKYFREYGTTLRGLQANHSVEMDDYLAFVHDVPLDRYLQPDPRMRSALEGLPGRRFIFTNADRAHAERVTAALGLEGLWQGIIDVHVLAPYCKPMPESFQLALKAAG
jgi:putative hydrolase of the HAD superfamily